MYIASGQYKNSKIEPYVIEHYIHLVDDVGMLYSPRVTSREVNIMFYYIRLYFTVFILARSNIHDIPFSTSLKVINCIISYTNI
jgi:hypothetical protein